MNPDIITVLHGILLSSRSAITSQKVWYLSKADPYVDFVECAKALIASCFCFKSNSGGRFVFMCTAGSHFSNLRCAGILGHRREVRKLEIEFTTVKGVIGWGWGR